MKNFWKWLIVSSADPTQLALTMKGMLGTVASIVIMLSPLFHIRVGQDQINSIVDAIIQIMTLLLGLISAVAGIIGLIRKLFTPQNQAVTATITATTLNLPR